MRLEPVAVLRLCRLWRRLRKRQRPKPLKLQRERVFSLAKYIPLTGHFSSEIPPVGLRLTPKPNGSLTGSNGWLNGSNFCKSLQSRKVYGLTGFFAVFGGIEVLSSGG